MALNKKKAKKFAMIAGLIGLFGFAYRYGSPLVRLKRDAGNPLTTFGAEVKGYLGADYTPAKIAEVYKYHVDNKSGYFNTYMAKGWALTQ